jgi:hypothetical protein
MASAHSAHANTPGRDSGRASRAAEVTAIVLAACSSPFGTATLDGVDHPPLWPTSVSVTLRTVDQPKPPGLVNQASKASTVG